MCRFNEVCEFTVRFVGPDGAPVEEGMWMCQGLSPPRETLPGAPQKFRGGKFVLTRLRARIAFILYCFSTEKAILGRAST